MGDRTILVMLAISLFFGIALGYLIGVASSLTSQATVTSTPSFTHTTEAATTSTSSLTLTPTTSTITCQTPTSSCQCTGIEYLQITYAYAAYKSGDPSYWNVTLRVENKGTSAATIDQMFVNGVPINPGGPASDTMTYQAGSLVLKPGEDATIYVFIGKDKASSGQQVEIKLHTASGKEYPKFVTLP